MRASAAYASSAAGSTTRFVLTSYGRSSGFCVDPVEKKSREIDTLASKATPGDIAQAADELGCRSVAFTYNGPTIFWEYVADACRDRGTRAIAVTAGYMCPQPRAQFYRHIDAANVDLKAFTEDFYRKVCVGHLDDVLDTLVYLRRQTDVWLEITTLLIPGRNDGDDEITSECTWIRENLGADMPVHFSPIPPRLQDDEYAADTARHADAGPPYRSQRRPAIRLHRKRPRHPGRQHVVSRLQIRGHRPRLVCNPPLRVDQ
jgi:pyruvate-formate lyase-activating enzyme